uniref:Uncharacterized protein n=1 Tax=Acrobeloides nanus TaxID=290746 RepID=A0A914DUI6_9BILA
MKAIIILALVCIAFVVCSEEEKISFEEMHVIAKRFIEWGKVDLGCTISCGAYWACVFKSNGDSCKSPPSCECREFAGK